MLGETVDHRTAREKSLSYTLPLRREVALHFPYQRILFFSINNNPILYLYFREINFKFKARKNQGKKKTRVNLCKFMSS